MEARRRFLFNLWSNLGVIYPLLLDEYCKLFKIGVLAVSVNFNFWQILVWVALTALLWRIWIQGPRRAPVQALGGSNLLRYMLRYSVGISCLCVCVCSCVCDPSVLYLPLSNQMMIKIRRSPCLLIMFTLTFRPQIPYFGEVNIEWPLTTTSEQHRSHLVRIRRMYGLNLQ